MDIPHSGKTEPNARAAPRAADVTAVYNRHIHTVYRLCLTLMGNKSDAEDAVQAVFMKLVEWPRAFENTEHEKAWLITAATHHCYDIHRQWWRRKTVPLEEYDGVSPGWPAQQAELLEQIGRLAPKYRAALYLYYYEGYRIAEMAKLLNTNESTIKTRLRTAKKRLKLELGGPDDD